MTRTPAEVQAHALRNAPPATVTPSHRPATDDRVGTLIAVGVVTQVDITHGKLLWRRVRYKTNPPQEGQVEMVGSAQDGYPLEGARLMDYDIWRVPDGASDLGFDFFPWLCTYRGGVWILSFIIKPDGTRIDTNLPDSGCGGN